MLDRMIVEYMWMLGWGVVEVEEGYLLRIFPRYRYTQIPERRAPWHLIHAFFHSTKVRRMPAGAAFAIWQNALKREFPQFLPPPPRPRSPPPHRPVTRRCQALLRRGQGRGRGRGWGSVGAGAFRT